MKTRRYKSIVANAGTNDAWETAGAQKREAVQSLFGDIAGRYDLVNSAMSLRLHHRWRTEAVRMLGLLPGDTVADVCCGTADFGLPLRRKIGDAGRIVGVDFCLPMLRVAQEKKAPMALNLGDACALPLASGSFDAVTVGWGLRNVADLSGALSEIHRVLKPGGRFVSLDMAKPRNTVVRFASSAAFSTLVPALGAVFGNRDAYKYLPKSTDTFASRSELKVAFEAVGFTGVSYADMFFGNICIHRGVA
ncbi:MAG: ubiquinone/menaquinone biosynthesis methyltransferase [Fimbriimonadales bacterium]